MRKFVIAGAAMLAATPALAQPANEDDWDVPVEARYEADLGRIAGAMDRMVGALMDLPVGGIAAAVDPLGRNGVRPGDTLRDLAERDDPYAEQRIRANIRGTARGIGAMSEAYSRMLPVLRRSLDEMTDSVVAALDAVDPGEPY